MMIEDRIDKIAKMIVAGGKRVRGIRGIEPDENGRMIAYHGSMSRHDRIEARTAGAYESLGDAIFLTKYFSMACGFAMNPGFIDNLLVENGVKYEGFNLNNSIEEMSRKKKSRKVSSIDIDLYLTFYGDDGGAGFEDGMTVSRDIYVHSVDIAPYVKEHKVKDIRHHDYEFVIVGEESVPVFKVDTVKANCRLFRDGAGTAVEKIRKFLDGNGKYMGFDVQDGGWTYILKENGKELGRIDLERKMSSSKIRIWLSSPEDASDDLKSCGLGSGNPVFRDADEAIAWLDKNYDKIMMVLRGEADA